MQQVEQRREGVLTHLRILDTNSRPCWKATGSGVSELTLLTHNQAGWCDIRLRSVTDSPTPERKRQALD